MSETEERVRLMNTYAWDIRRSYPQKSLDIAREAGKLANAAGLYEQEAYSFRNTGTALYLLSRYEEGLNDLNKASDLFKAQDNLHALATTIRTIGNIWHSIDDNPKAINCYEQAINITTKLDDRQGTAYNNGNIGYVYKKMGKYELALEFMEKTFAILFEENDLLGLSDVQTNLGDVYKELGQNDKALELFQDSLKNALEINHLRGIGNAHCNLGTFFTEAEDYASAIRHLEAGLVAAEEMGEQSLMAVLYKQYSKALEHTGDHKKALHFYRKYAGLNETALKDLNSNNLSAMRAQFAVDMAVSESERYKKQNAELASAKAELERLSIVAKQTNDGVVILHADGATEWVNEAYTRITGFKLEDLIGTQPGDALIGEKTDKETLARIRSKLRKTQSWKERVLVYHKSGHEIWLQISSTPVFDDDGKHIKQIEIINDVTEKVHNEQELERLSLVASETENVILILDADGNLEWINESFERLNNLTKAELIAERGQNIRTISNNPDMGAILDECTATGKSVKYDSLNLTNDGKRVWESSTLTPIFDEKGELEHFIIIDTDITQLKDAQDEIHEKNSELERLSIVAEKMNEAVIITDADGNIEYYNYGLVRNSGFTEEEFKEEFKDLMKLQLLTSQNVDEIIEGFKTSSEPYFYDSTHQKKDGSLMWTNASLSPVYNDQNELSKIIVVYTDIDERKRFNDQIKEKNKEIMDSISYAKRLQDAILPSTALMQRIFSESFILYKPKDMVSGDFYWLQEVNETLLFAAADCTGHGVPGAMVSFVCHNALNRVIREYQLLQPAEVLDKTTDIVIEQFARNVNDVNDGMDIALCTLNGTTLSYSGANNPLWLLRDNDILEIKATKQPVGKYLTRKPFVNHELEVQKGDVIYLFSDGYADQFGGERKKKFNRANLKRLLVDIGGKPLHEQHDILDTTFENWRGDLEQIDDVCVLGVKI